MAALYFLFTPSKASKWREEKQIHNKSLCFWQKTWEEKQKVSSFFSSSFISLQFIFHQKEKNRIYLFILGEGSSGIGCILFTGIGGRESVSINVIFIICDVVLIKWEQV